MSESKSVVQSREGMGSGTKKINEVRVIEPVEVFAVTVDMVDPTGLPRPDFVAVEARTRNILAFKIGGKIRFLDVQPLNLPEWVGEQVADKIAKKEFGEPKVVEKASGAQQV